VWTAHLVRCRGYAAALVVAHSYSGAAQESAGWHPIGPMHHRAHSCTELYDNLCAEIATWFCDNLE